MTEGLTSIAWVVGSYDFHRGTTTHCHRLQHLDKPPQRTRVSRGVKYPRGEIEDELEPGSSVSGWLRHRSHCRPAFPDSPGRGQLGGALGMARPDWLPPGIVGIYRRCRHHILTGPGRACRG